MKTLRLTTALLTLSTAFATAALAQAHDGSPATAPRATQTAPVTPPPAGPSAEVQRSYASLKANILKAADKMPDADYHFRPTPDIRTYARVVNHITEAQLHACGAFNGLAMTALPKVPEETADKAAIIEALKTSFAECDKAYADASDTTVGEIVSIGPAKRSRIGLLWGNVSHDNEQYATLALYLRLKNLVPPSSEK